MKNFLVAAVTAALAWFIYDAMQVEPVPVRPIMVAATPSPSAPKLYFHSALDAPPMSPGASTGTSYFSAEQASRFNGYSSLGAGYPYSSSTTNTYINVPVGSTSTGVTAANRSPLQSAAQNQSSVYVQRPLYQPTPAPGGTAR